MPLIGVHRDVEGFRGTARNLCWKSANEHFLSLPCVRMGKRASWVGEWVGGSVGGWVGGFGRPDLCSVHLAMRTACVCSASTSSRFWRLVLQASLKEEHRAPIHETPGALSLPFACVRNGAGRGRGRGEKGGSCIGII